MPQAFVFYQYFHPDDVVSAVLLSEFSAGLVERGWAVTAFPSNRSFSGSRDHPPEVNWEGVSIRRRWRPDWSQSAQIGRLLNSLWMISSWSALAFSANNSPDVIIIGTDPILSICIAPVWRLCKPRTKIVHWCFDLYPEAAIADGLLPSKGAITGLLRTLCKFSYSKCDLIVDIGCCMRSLLKRYHSSAIVNTITPWAIAERKSAAPVPVLERSRLFGDAALALMYSGSYGRAHSCEDLLQLIRLLRQDSVQLAFSVRGHREASLRAAIGPDDINVFFIPFAPPDKLELQLASADIQVVSLREEWTGTVVPSKFFGALAIGRPVLFCGSNESAIAHWIRKYEVGWVLSKGNVEAIATELQDIIRNPERMEQMRQRCYEVYSQNFAQHVALDRWHRALSTL